MNRLKMSFDSPNQAGLVVEPINARCTVEEAMMIFSQGWKPAFLESSLQPSEFGRWSLLAAEPIDEIVIPSDTRPPLFDGLAQRLERYPRLKSETTLPFAGGWIGFIAYEAGLLEAGIARTQGFDASLPLAGFRLYDSAAVYDHERGQWYAVAVDWPSSCGIKSLPTADRLKRITERLLDASPLEQTDREFQRYAPPLLGPAPQLSFVDYAQMVDAARQYIAAGDVYQVNLSMGFQTQTDVPPYTLYGRLRRANPSTHAAYLPWGGFSILSASPELFLELRSGLVLTRPIKGTRPRGVDEPTDQRNRRSLAESEKDRAELNMIIDLLRNDLGRVCRFGSVRVREAARIEEHPTVFHRVASIEGRLDEGRTWTDLLQAAFPGGSITGAPKIRAMQIIQELERCPRGVYCGSLGIIGLEGSLSLNIAIRTLVQRGNQVTFRAGGAIIAESTAEDEYQEIQAKAKGLVRALQRAHSPAGPRPHEPPRPRHRETVLP